jgi:hypothetical protein
LLQALGISETVWVGKNGMDIMIEVPSAEGVIEGLNPNFVVSRRYCEINNSHRNWQNKTQEVLSSLVKTH